MISLRSGLNEKSETEYYLVGLVKYEAFDLVISELLRLEATILESLDGIYSRTSTMEINGDRFKVIYHEDVGVYLFTLGEQSEDKNIKLQTLLEKVVENINLQE